MGHRAGKRRKRKGACTGSKPGALDERGTCGGDAVSKRKYAEPLSGTAYVGPPHAAGRFRASKQVPKHCDLQ
jgi:hypothetical protein